MAYKIPTTPLAHTVQLETHWGVSPGQINKTLIAEDLDGGSESPLAQRSAGNNKQNEMKNEDTLQLLFDDVLFTSFQVTADTTSTIDENGSIPSSDHGYSP